MKTTSSNSRKLVSVNCMNMNVKDEKTISNKFEIVDGASGSQEPNFDLENGKPIVKSHTVIDNGKKMVVEINGKRRLVKSEFADATRQNRKISEDKVPSKEYKSSEKSESAR